MNRKTALIPNPKRVNAPRRHMIAASLLAAAVIATPSLAHKTFLAPSQYVWDSGTIVEVAFTSGLAFPDIESGPARDRISFTAVIVDNQAVEEVAYEESETALNVTFMADDRGLAVIAMSSFLRSGEIAPEDASAYLNGIGADDTVRQAFEDLPGSPALNRSYIKHTKTFICIETCENGRESSYAPIGQTLEFVAVESHGRTFGLVRDGAPLEGHRVAIFSHDGHQLDAVTDENGWVEIDGSMSGAVMLSAIWITLPDQADGVYHSDQATLTVDLGQAN